MLDAGGQTGFHAPHDIHVGGRVLPHDSGHELRRFGRVGVPLGSLGFGGWIPLLFVHMNQQLSGNNVSIYLVICKDK